MKRAQVFDIFHTGSVSMNDQRKRPVAYVTETIKQNLKYSQNCCVVLCGLTSEGQKKPAHGLLN